MSPAEGDPASLAEDVERLLDSLDPRVRDTGEELVRVLMRFYGAGLEQLLEIVRLGAGDALVHRAAADPLVAALLALHDLHPVELGVRAGHAIDAARRRLGHHGTGITLERVDTHSGTVHVSLGAGCGSSSDTVRDVVRTAVAELCPEVADVVFAAEPAGPALLQIGLGPPSAAPASPAPPDPRSTAPHAAPGAADPAWRARDHAADAASTAAGS